MAEGDVKYLYTQGLLDTAEIFKKNIDDFHDAKEKVSSTTTTLLETWVGKSRNRFESRSKLLLGELSDIEDALYEIYNGIVDGVTGYYDADEELAKQLNQVNG
jgi:uncharacterized protein YukE